MNKYLKQMTRLGLFCAALMTMACGHQDLNRHYRQMRPNMMRGNWKGAVAQMTAAKKTVYGEKDRIMYWLNMGTLQHYALQTDASMKNFVAAEKAMQDLWTKSVSAEASKFLVNETAQSYPGEDYEKVLVYLYTSLNHAIQGKYQDAQVEARAADRELQKMKVYYEKEGCPKGVSPDKCGTVYTQDAFMLWLVGLYREIEGMKGDGESLQDALSLYKDAYRVYNEQYAGRFGASAPGFLAEDIVRVATALGRAGEAQSFAGMGATGQSLKNLQNGMGEVILFHGSGESPVKRQLKFNARMPDGYMMSMAVPQVRARRSRVAYAKVTAGNVSAMTELAEPITQIAVKNFAKKLPAIKGRAVARAIVKYAATKGAQAVAKKAGGGLLGSVVGLVGNVASAATEAADLRSWSTLPANVGIARLWLPAGQHTLLVTYHGGNNMQIGRTDTIQITVKPGERNIVSVRSLQ